MRVEYIRPDKLDPGTTLKCLDYIDVPSSGKREHKLSFYSHKEGQLQFKVRDTKWSNILMHSYISVIHQAHGLLPKPSVHIAPHAGGVHQ